MSATYPGRIFEVPAFVRAQTADTEQVEPERVARKPLPHGVIERDCAQRGIWSLEPKQAAQLQLPLTSADRDGQLVLTSAPLGTLGTYEMQVCVALMGRWAAGERTSPYVDVSLHGLAESLGLAWSGRTSRDLRAALGRLVATTFEFIEYDPDTRRGREGAFHILDSYRGGWTGERDEPKRQLRVKFSDWTMERLEARQVSDIRLDVLRQLPSPLAKRLYVYLESFAFFPGGLVETDTTVEPVKQFDRVVDERFSATLGSSDTRQHRFRQKLQAAGRAIVAADSRYRAADVIPRATGAGFKLRIVRGN